jgi:hypothetical protein
MSNNAIPSVLGPRFLENHQEWNLSDMMVSSLLHR